MNENAKGASRSFDEIVNDTISRSFGTYTVGAGNLERVIGLVVDDVLGNLRDAVEAQVRRIYGIVFPVAQEPKVEDRRQVMCSHPSERYGTYHYVGDCPHATQKPYSGTLS